MCVSHVVHVNFDYFVSVGVVLACKWKSSLADKLGQVSRECGVQEEGILKINRLSTGSQWSDLSTGVICSGGINKSDSPRQGSAAGAILKGIGG